MGHGTVTFPQKETLLNSYIFSSDIFFSDVALDEKTQVFFFFFFKKTLQLADIIT